MASLVLRRHLYLLSWRRHKIEVVALLVCLACNGALAAEETVWAALAQSERLSIDRLDAL